jgi:hypothetical protein
MKTNHSPNLTKLAGLITGVIVYCSIFIQANAQTQAKPFVSIVSSDETNKYFEADLSQFPSFLEKAYFLELIFKDSILVVQNSSLKNKFLQLSCNNKLSTEKALLHISDLKSKTIKDSGGMNNSKKAILIKKYEKYR